jgi:hypothetical protein
MTQTTDTQATEVFFKAQAPSGNKYEFYLNHIYYRFLKDKDASDLEKNTRSERSGNLHFNSNTKGSYYTENRIKDRALEEISGLTFIRFESKYQVNIEIGLLFKDSWIRILTQLIEIIESELRPPVEEIN